MTKQLLFQVSAVVLSLTISSPTFGGVAGVVTLIEKGDSREFYGLTYKVVEGKTGVSSEGGVWEGKTLFVKKGATIKVAVKNPIKMVSILQDWKAPNKGTHRVELGGGPGSRVIATVRIVDKLPAPKGGQPR